ncbi:hypothetical protein TrCOL_g8944 [Triparma columacea]|uniref:Magnesium transporter n=1 Tax=Triparma columacea TaxID=722753 RepID=A0A9W7GCV8_9STRA|nr:hypothetical protein TrCOL_g8944 [Triparma columacea]
MVRCPAGRCVHVGTSLLFSAPESWLVSESQTIPDPDGRGGKDVSKTFGLAYAGDSVVAIAAGQLASVAARTRGETGPFELSAAFLVLGAAGNLRTSSGHLNHSPLGRSILTTPHRPLPSLHLTSPFTPPNVVNYTKRQLSTLVTCGYRDLRCLDEKYDKRGKGSVILPREGGLIVKVCLSRAVIVKHKEGDRVSCYVFPGTPHSEELVKFLEQGGEGEEGEGGKIKGVGGARIFECLVGMGLEEVVGRFEGVKSDVYKILGELGDMRTSVGGGKSAKFGFLSTQRKVTELLPLKNKLDSLEGILTDIYNTFMELLQDESDMGLIAGCLGDCKKEHVELMLEDTLQQAEEIRQSVRDVQAYVKNSEEIMEIELSLIRNRIMRFELLLEITGLMVACGAAVTGLFGMNLVSHLEDSWWVFYGTTGFIIVLMSGIFKGLIEQCRADNIL